MKSVLLPALVFFLNAPALPAAAELRCAGVLGNSGAQGATLVKFGRNSSQGSMTAQGAQGIGVVVDRDGALWDRAGAGVLNRYSVDGRLLASYSIPSASCHDDVIALAGDSLMLLINHQLLTLSPEAPGGSAATDLKIQANFLSPGTGTPDGFAAAATAKGEIFLVNASGLKKTLTTLPEARISELALAPDGAVWLREENTMLRLPPEHPDKPEKTGRMPGERFQFVDGYCYGTSHHSTIRRFSSDLQPAPGVVMGGNSGSFIGHVDEQAEVGLGQGLAKAGPDLFAVSGQGGILHLVAWQEDGVRFQPLRRIGAVPQCSALALDRKGRVWFRSGCWNWDDGPASPLRFGVPEPEAVFGLTMTDSDTVLGLGRLWNKPAIISGGFGKEVKLNRFEEPSQLPAEAMACTVLRRKNQSLLVAMRKDGSLSSAILKPDGSFAGDGPAMALHPVAGVMEWTSLVSPDGLNLLAAADGDIIAFQPDGENAWKETSRWHPDGTTSGKTGSTCRLAADAGRLWISDTGHHRVICMDAASHAVIASFGVQGEAGDDLRHLNSPTTIACRENRAVVFDSGNQRLVKLELVP